MDYESVISAVGAWTIDDRLRLVREICGQLLEQGIEPELTEGMKAELVRRMDELDLNPDAGNRWERTKARVLGNLGR